MTNNAQSASPLATMSLREYAMSKNIVSVVPKIRINQSGYPYVTMINSDNVAENVYFSKKAAEAISDDVAVDKTFFKGYQIGLCTNEAGEARTKLISNSERVSITDLFE